MKQHHLPPSVCFCTRCLLSFAPFGAISSWSFDYVGKITLGGKYFTSSFPLSHSRIFHLVTLARYLMTVGVFHVIFLQCFPGLAPWVLSWPDKIPFELQWTFCSEENSLCYESELMDLALIGYALWDAGGAGLAAATVYCCAMSLSHYEGQSGGGVVGRGRPSRCCPRSSVTLFCISSLAWLQPWRLEGCGASLSTNLQSQNVGINAVLPFHGR